MWNYKYKHQGYGYECHRGFLKWNLSYAQESGIQGRFIKGHDASGLTASSISKESNIDPVSQDSANSKRGRKFQFTFAGKTTETFELQQDIKKYIRNFEKHDIDSESDRSNCYNMDEYNLQASAQSLLFDSVILKNRIESGSLLVCGGGITISFSPFASFIWMLVLWEPHMFHVNQGMLLRQTKNTLV